MEIFKQGTLGDDGLSPTARLLIGVLGNLNNKETIRDFLKEINKAVRAEGSPKQIGMFEANTKPSNELNGYYGGVFNVVVTLFDRNKQSIEDYRREANNVIIYSSFGENSKGASSNHSGNHVPSYDYETPSSQSLAENFNNRNPTEYTKSNYSISKQVFVVPFTSLKKVNRY